MERREQHRYPVRQVRPSASEKRLPYRLLNVSRSGCSLEALQSLGAVHSRIVVELPLPGGAGTLILAARVAWRLVEPAEGRARRFRYGLEFESPDKVTGLILDAYVGFLRRDLHIAQLEEAWRKLKRVHERIELLIASEEKKSATYLH